jgi:hypothetical protein
MVFVLAKSISRANQSVCSYRVGFVLPKSGKSAPRYSEEERARRNAGIGSDIDRPLCSALRLDTPCPL